MAESNKRNTANENQIGLQIESQITPTFCNWFWIILILFFIAFELYFLHVKIDQNTRNLIALKQTQYQLILMRSRKAPQGTQKYKDVSVIPDKYIPNYLKHQKHPKHKTKMKGLKEK